MLSLIHVDPFFCFVMLFPICVPEAPEQSAHQRSVADEQFPGFPGDLEPSHLFVDHLYGCV